jgi:hypothetical protein|tara:strand:- start:3120 stop:3812 length:693 start_codon:yes stop_codon:yes gene_type:complete
MMGTFGGNVGPINTPTTGQGAIAGFDPVLKFSRRATKSRKKKESAGKQWEHRRDDPSYIDGRSKQARKLIKRLAKRKKKMTEEFLAEGGEATKQAYKFLSQRRKVQKKQEREKRAANRKQEIQTISRAKASDYQKKSKDRMKKVAQSASKDTKKEAYDGLGVLDLICQQVTENHEKPTTYFFYDDTELELTVKEAAYIVVKFNELSEENRDGFIESLGQTSRFVSDFIEL